MKRLNEKQSKRRPSLTTLACLAVGVGLFIAWSFLVLLVNARRDGEVRSRHLATATPTELAASSLEGQIRIQNKSLRRQPAFGLLPSGSELELPVLNVERSHAEALCQILTTCSSPNDRAPPGTDLIETLIILGCS